MRLTEIAFYTDVKTENPGIFDEMELLRFGLTHETSKTEYLIRNIIGLDADEVVPRFYGFGTYTGHRFYEYSIKARELVMRIALNPKFKVNRTYSELRDELYRMISTNRTGLIGIYFFSGAATIAKIKGFITKFEAVYFTELPEVQLTIHCDDPMFRSVNPVYYEHADVITNFSTLKIPDSLSTSPHGFSMKLTCNTQSDVISIMDRPDPGTEWFFTVRPDGGFLPGDKLYFSSEFSDKYLYLDRPNEDYTYLMDKVDPLSVWPILFPGQNLFSVSTGAAWHFDSVFFNAAYWGV